MDDQYSTEFQPFAAKMRAAELPELAIATFAAHYARLRNGECAFLREEQLEPARELPNHDALGRYEADGHEALSRCAVLKLNGGLATSMGMTRAKSLLVVQEGLSFLEIIVRHVQLLRQRFGVPLPLLFMNSFRTRDDTLAALARYPKLNGELAVDFLQHRVPKIDAQHLGPASWPAHPEHEWCPPGHGDLYTALATSGTLEALIAAGLRYAFVSNADNLGATLEPRILGWMEREAIPFAMEVTPRTHGDRKGGHLARWAGAASVGGFVLRESAQCAPEDRVHFEDVARHRYFNTNNLWVDLRALRDALAAGPLELPLIQNRKTVDPRDPGSPAVIQLETAMGSAISIFPRAAAVAVPRDRFAPVKTTNDLLAVRSDAYRLSGDARIVPAPGSCARELRIDLDPAYYQRIDDFEARFPAGAPSLKHCTSFVVRGDISFGAGVAVEGDVELVHDGPEPLHVDGPLVNPGDPKSIV